MRGPVPFFPWHAGDKGGSGKVVGRDVEELHGLADTIRAVPQSHFDLFCLSSEEIILCLLE